MAVEQGPDGLTDPGPLPTTLMRTVVEEDTPARAALRAARFRIEELRTAVIAARAFFRMTYPEIVDGVPSEVALTPTGEAVQQWIRRFGALADPPLAVEVEEDDDEEREPVETAYSVREEEHTTHVYLRTDGSLEREIGTIGSADDLPILLHLVADEMVKTRG
jgi:hypothetical protein